MLVPKLLSDLPPCLEVRVLGSAHTPLSTQHAAARVVSVGTHTDILLAV
jgi:hypothetical protein